MVPIEHVLIFSAALFAIGGASISPKHANFIVNEGGATAADIHALIARCQLEVRQQFGVELREEIVRLGGSTSQR